MDAMVLAGERLLATVAPPSGRRRLREPPLDLVLRLARTLESLSDELRGRNDDLDALARRALGTAGELEECLDAPELERVVWAEPGTLAWAPVDVSGPLRELLWDDGPTAVLVSATLAVNDSFAFPRRRLGIDRASELSVGSPYDYREQALLYLPRSMPDPRSPGRTRAGRRGGRRALRALARPRARADELVPRARRDRRAGPQPGSRTRCSSRARRHASGCSSASAPRSTPS